jgi:hypothetical protein
VPDVEFECWRRQDVEKIEEALVLWPFILADVGESQNAALVTDTLLEMKRLILDTQRRRLSEVDLTDDGWRPPVGYKPLREVWANRRGFWWHKLDYIFFVFIVCTVYTILRLYEAG